MDAKTGMPLKFTLTPASGGKAVVDVGFTKVDFGKPAASTFDFTPAQGREGHRGRRGEGRGSRTSAVQGPTRTWAKGCRRASKG